MIRTLLIVLLLCGSADAQRYCNSPFCQMCNRLEAQYNSRLRLQVPLAGPVPVAVPNPVAATPTAAIDVMLQELDLGPDDVLYDLGCGDGRVLIRAVEQYGCQAVGIEINPGQVTAAMRNVAEAGCGRIRIQEGDATRLDLSGATAVVMHLYPDVIERLVPRIKANRIASYMHDMPGIATRRVPGRFPIFVSILEVTEGWSWVASAD